MREKLHKMMSKKRDLSPNERHAKMDVIKEMRNAASELMGGKMDGLKKVSVMSDSKQGLKHGLDKAKEIVSDGEEDQMQHDAEAPYSDDKHAMEEHMGEDQSNNMGDESHGKQAYAEGGEVEGLEESPDQGDYEAVDQESPAEEESEDEDENEFHGLDMHELDDKLQKLMKMREKMGHK